MAILEVRRTFEGETSDEEITSFTEQTDRDTWTYLVKTDTAATTVRQARSADDGVRSIPSLGFIRGDGLMVLSRSASRDSNSPKLFRVTVVFGTLRGPEGLGGARWGFTFKITGDRSDEDVNVDRNKKPILNTAGDPFDPPLKKRLKDFVLHVGFHCYAGSVPVVAELANCINSDDITMQVRGVVFYCPPGTLQMGQPNIEPVMELTGSDPTQLVWRCEIELAYRAETWKRKVPSMGYRKKDSDGKLVQITDERGNAITTPVYLDADGKVLANGNEAHLIEVEIDEEAPFAPMLAGVLI